MPSQIYLLMGLLDYIGDALNALAMPVQAVGNLFSSVTGASDAFKTMTGRGDTSAMSQAKDMATFQMENQKNLMTYGNDLQVAQWNRENAYNSPGAQMNRLQSAGLNPLFHGLDGNSSGGLSAVTAPSAPDIGALLNAAASTMQMQMQKAQIGSQINLANAEAAKVKQETENLKTEGKRASIQLYYDVKKKEFDFKPSWGEVTTLVNGEEQTDNIPLPNNFETRMDYELRSITSGAKKLANEAELTGYQRIYESLREGNYDKLIENELRKSNYDTDAAKWAVEQLKALIYQIQLGNSFSELDFGTYKDTKELEDKLGAFGSAIRLFRSLNISGARDK